MKILEEKKGGVLILQPDSELMGGDETKQLLDRFYEAIREGTVNIILNVDEQFRAWDDYGGFNHAPWQWG